MRKIFIPSVLVLFLALPAHAALAANSDELINQGELLQDYVDTGGQLGMTEEEADEFWGEYQEDVDKYNQEYEDQLEKAADDLEDFNSELGINDNSSSSDDGGSARFNSYEKREDDPKKIVPRLFHNVDPR